MNVHIVYKEISSETLNHNFSILDVFFSNEKAVECVEKEYESFVLKQKEDPTYNQQCFIVERTLLIENDEVVNLAIKACPKPEHFFHQTDESIYCAGFIDGYHTATLK